MQNSLQRIWAIVIRHLFSWRRDLESLTESFWWPSFDLFIWGLTSIYLREQQGTTPYVLAVFVGAIVLWMFVYRSQQEIGFLFLKEVWDRNLLNVLTTPITIWEYTFGAIILGTLKLILSALWMGILAYLLFKLNIFFMGWYLIPFILNLILVGWSSGFVINGLIIRYGYRVQAFAWTLILIIQPFSAVFYPVSAMPGWMKSVARFLPTSYVFEGMRQIVFQNQMDWQLLYAAGGLNLLYLVISVFYFNYCFRKAQESGMIVKFS